MSDDNGITCVYCGLPVAPYATGTWREVTGWVQQRKAGGANAVKNQQDTGIYACQDCMELVKRGIDPGLQQPLFT